MITIGLAGQIASGKSMVAQVFEEQGAVVISGDQLGREVVENDRSILKQLTATFGKEILTPSGKLKRRELGSIAFADDQSAAKLNAIVHPVLLKKLCAKLTQLRKSDSVNVAVIDAALIFDWGLERELDYVIVVESTVANQIRRMKSAGIIESETKKRIARQTPKYLQRDKADFVIHNNGTLRQLRAKALKLYQRLTK